MTQDDRRSAYNLYHRYLTLLHLHHLCGTGDSEEAEGIRDHMDIIWVKLGADNQAQLKELSSRLYVANPIHANWLVGWLHMFFHSLFRVHRMASSSVPIMEDEVVKHVSCQVCFDCGTMFHADPCYLAHVKAMGDTIVPPKTLWQYLKLDQAAAWCLKLKRRIENWKRRCEAEGNYDYYFGPESFYGTGILRQQGAMRILFILNALRRHHEQIMADYMLFPVDLRKLITDNGMKDTPTEDKSCNSTPPASTPSTDTTTKSVTMAEPGSTPSGAALPS